MTIFWQGGLEAGRVRDISGKGFFTGWHVDRRPSLSFSQTYVALHGPTGVIQTPEDIMAHLSDRLSLATLLVDGYAALLTLKGLVRDCKQDVGDCALTGLL